MTNTHLNDLFDRMEPEKGNELDDKIQVTEDPLIKEVAESFNAYINSNPRKSQGFKDSFQNIYNNFSNQYTAKEITKISTYLSCSSYLDDSLGFFFNVLIQKSKDQDHTIHISNTQSNISHFGYQNVKNIIVFGDLGVNIGKKMISGSITINGNAGGYVGNDMEGGTITINGNAGREPGYLMNGGELTINGSYIGEAGAWSKSGSIYVNGELNNGYFSNTGRAKIYQNGTLVFYKGYPTPKKIILDIKKHIKQKLTK